MKKLFKPFPKQEAPPPKATKQLVDAFCDTYKPVPTEDMAEDLFTMRKLREYFQAWPLPKMPDPLPPYLDELEQRGYAMQTGYDGTPSIFCIRWKARGEICQAEETDDDTLRTGAQTMKQIIERRLSKRPATSETDPDESDEDPDEGEDDEDDNEGGW